MNDPVSRACRLGYPAYHHSGERSQAAIRYVVLHSTEGPTALGAAEFFTRPGSGGSANLVVDDHVCYRCLNDTVIPWGAPPLNTHGFHIEQAGFAAWTRAEWLTHTPTIVRAAYKAAIRCRLYRIPARVLDVAALERDFGDIPAGDAGGVPAHPGPLRGGIVTHATISQAYRQSDHTDPGPGYPLDVFMQHLEAFLNGAQL
jgi:hypothetical protein